LIPTPLPGASEPTSTTLRMTRPHAAPGRGGAEGPEVDLDTDEVRITDEIPAPDEHTRAGTTRRWTSRGVSVDADTHALHTAASRAAEPTAAAPTAAAPIVSPPDEPRPKRQRRKKVAEVAEPAAPDPRPVTGAHPVRTDPGATTVLRPRPRPRPDPTLETGALLADDPEPSQLDTRREPTRTAWIPNTARTGWIVHHGGRSWAVDGDRPLVIGRSPLADAQLPDRNVSRKHLELRPDGAGLTLTSLKADNPIWLDGRPLTDVTRLDPKHGTWTLKLGNSEVLLTWANPRR
ncbi:MAG: FHA domain-containing protein, partial [Myxococcota bacterium]